ESNRMGHCVGRSHTYSNRCLWGQGHIISVRSRDGLRSYSTAELGHFQHGDRTFRLAQHQGVRNARPVAEALQAFKEWNQAILSFALPVNHDEVESYAAFAREHYRDQIHGTEVRDRARISWRG